MDRDILNELIPIESLQEQKQKIIEQLEEKKYKINSFEDGSVFGTIIMTLFQVKNDLLNMSRNIYLGLLVKYAPNTWLDIKAEEYTKKRKQAVKAEGILTIKRETIEDPLIIPQGYVFKTLPSIAGKEYKFISTEKTTIKSNEPIGYIKVIAQENGSDYNVPLHSIKRSLIHIKGVLDIDNDKNWLIKEGADRENDESFRQRTLNSWAELSTTPIALKYKNVAESVEGVLYVIVADLHPRGQGTVDIIVASYTGNAGDKLLSDVANACETIRGPYDNLLVKSAETIPIDIDIILYLPKYIDHNNINERASQYIRNYFKVNQNRQLNMLYLSELSFCIRKNIDELCGIKILSPSNDLKLEKNKVIILGSINITIERI